MPVVLGMTIFAPAVAEIRLPMAPRLASWDAAAHPSQQKLTSYLAATGQLLLPLIADTPEPLALRLEVGLTNHVDVLREHDLDNYLLPLARHLTTQSKRVFRSVSGSKSAAGDSFVGLSRADPVPLPRELNMWTARTSASAETRAYKEQIRQSLEGARELPDGPVQLEIVFTIGPARSWLNLWKPTIDALGPLLGISDPRREWHPRDGRITQLGLHCQLDPKIGYGVELKIAAASLR